MKESNDFAVVENADLVNVSISSHDSSDLLDDVRSMLKNDVKSLAEVRKFIRTPQTFENSAGNIYFYLKDKEICSQCSGKLSLCPKKNFGYELKLVYDKERDEIKTALKECPYMKNALAILNHISPNSIPIFQPFLIFNKILNNYADPANRASMKDVSNLIFNDTLEKIHSYDANKTHLGYAIYSINSVNLSKNVMKAMAFMYAKSDFHVAYMDAKSIFENLQSRDFSVKEQTEAIYEKYCYSPILFIEDIFDLPYMSGPFASEYLYPFLKARNEKGKITYCNLTANSSLVNFLSLKFRQTDLYDEVKELVKKIFVTKNIKDFDLL
jgi:hypothetical protein